ncbi:hypothetical protein [Nocardia cyriacigeorgica]|uniref:hypothetical protein n=1 Tax=Nocardia cyriacigeorgica TaxID=135487 RepID=UPI002456F0B7|nr:hypothetical protein [Nocardia cyriacigeorgica]
MSADRYIRYGFETGGEVRLWGMGLPVGVPRPGADDVTIEAMNSQLLVDVTDQSALDPRDIAERQA